MKENKKGNLKPVKRERDESGFWKIDKLNRIDPPMTPEAIQVMSWLNDQDRAVLARLLERLTNPRHPSGVGKGELPVLDRIQPTNAVPALLNDPEMFELYFELTDRLVKMVTGLDGNDEMYTVTTHARGIDVTSKRNDSDVRRRLANALLICLAIGVENDDPYWMRFMTAVPIMQNEPFEKNRYHIGGEKVAMLTRPESSVWTDEERLILQLTYATMRHEMTDELWDECMARWGVKETFRYIAWLGMYAYSLQFQDVIFRREVW
ncbi:MAG: hypothetical protein HKP58_16070 [Desulfatitalea sp.]|nr:hypothetical protein [Desulfatitalea sp.]NNK01929.1 hypothetical protein [Desulfatitalea sp.]